MRNLALSAILALPVALASQAMISLLLGMIDPESEHLGKYIIYVVLAVQLVIWALTTLHLAKFSAILRKVECVMIWAGLVLVATIPLIFGIMMIEAHTDTSPDKGGAVAAFFMLILFGGAYGGIGMILLIAGFMLRRNRKSAE